MISRRPKLALGQLDARIAERFHERHRGHQPRQRAIDVASASSAPNAAGVPVVISRSRDCNASSVKTRPSIAPARTGPLPSSPNSTPTSCVLVAHERRLGGLGAQARSRKARHRRRRIGRRGEELLVGDAIPEIEDVVARRPPSSRHQLDAAAAVVDHRVAVPSQRADQIGKPDSRCSVAISIVMPSAAARSRPRHRLVRHGTLLYRPRRTGRRCRPSGARGLEARRASARSRQLWAADPPVARATRRRRRVFRFSIALAVAAAVEEPTMRRKLLLPMSMMHRGALAAVAAPAGNALMRETRTASRPIRREPGCRRWAATSGRVALTDDGEAGPSHRQRSFTRQRVREFESWVTR